MSKNNSIIGFIVGAAIGSIVTWTISKNEYEKRKLLVCGGLNREQKYLVDELQIMLSQMNVETATVDVNYIESIGEDI